MYKIKIIFLYEDCTWSHQWVDWDGTGDMQDIVDEYREKEEKALKEDNMDKEVEYVVDVECVDTTDGHYNCGGCDCYFAKKDDGACPYCGSRKVAEGLYVEVPE